VNKNVKTGSILLFWRPKSLLEAQTLPRRIGRWVTCKMKKAGLIMLSRAWLPQTSLFKIP